MADKNSGTPHINANPDDFAKTVLLPGDPLRSKYIAENYIEDAVLINNVRGVQGYTGKYKGVPVTVMASGMGMPSMGIYSYELYSVFGVENIIRIGSTGGIADEVKLRDIVIAMGCSTNSKFADQYNLPGCMAPIADFTLLETAVDVCRDKGSSVHVGNILTSDVFYNDDPEANARWRKLGLMCVEMEAYALYLSAARCGTNGLAILTISDHLITGEETTAEERQNSFTQMMQVALDTAVEMDKK